MTTAALSPSKTYIEDGVTLNFAVPFRYLAASSLQVDRIATSGTVTRLVLNVDYTATPGTTDAGGTLTLISTVAEATLRIRRATARNQSTDYTTNDRFPAESHEAALDRAMLIDQEQDVQIADTQLRALLVPDGEAVSTLPAKTVRAGGFLGFDVNGNPVIVTSTSTLPEVAGAANVIRLSALLGGETLADESAGLGTAMALMNATRRPLLIDRSINVSSFTVINGYCVVACADDCWINFTGGATGFSAINTWTDLGAWTAAPTGVQFPAGTGSIVSAFVVDTATFNALAVNDWVYLKDSVGNRFVYDANTTGLAELARVIGKSGSTIYLDRVLDEQVSYAASGRVYKVNDNLCRLKLNVRGEQTTLRDAIRIEGYVRSICDLEIDGNSGRGFMPVSCAAPVARVVARNLRDDSAAGAYGYGVSPYGATTDGFFQIYAVNCRHAYTDGIIDTVGMRQGVCRRNTVTGVGVSCSAATWDTHPNSDDTHFADIVAWGTHNDAGQPNIGLNFAVQVRGTNVTLANLRTNLRSGIIYVVNAVNGRASLTEVRDFRHELSIAAPYSGLNVMTSVGFFSATGTGTHAFVCRDSQMHNYTTTPGSTWSFVRFDNCQIDRTTTSQGIGGDSTSAIVLNQCDVLNASSVQLPGSYTLIGGRFWFANGGNVQLIDGSKCKAFGPGIARPSGTPSANLCFASTTIASGTVEFEYANLWSDCPADTPGALRPFTDLSTGGTVTVRNRAAPGPYNAVRYRGNADATLQFGVDEDRQVFNTTLTANRTVTLLKKGAVEGARFIIPRKAAGAFSLTVVNDTAGPTIGTQVANDSCAYSFDGTDWVLDMKGTC